MTNQHVSQLFNLIVDGEHVQFYRFALNAPNA